MHCNTAKIGECGRVAASPQGRTQPEILSGLSQLQNQPTAENVVRLKLSFWPFWDSEPVQQLQSKEGNAVK